MKSSKSRSSSRGIYKIREAIKSQKRTDRRMSGAWLLAVFLGPIIPVTVGVLAFVFLILRGMGSWTFNGTPMDPMYPNGSVQMRMWSIWGFIGLVILGILIGMILVGTLIYKLIDRRNDHFERSRALRDGLITFLEDQRGGKKSTQIVTLRSLHADLKASENKKSPLFFTVLSIIVFPVALYVMYFLTKDFGEHFRKERIFYKEASEVMEQYDFIIPYPDWKQPPDRSAGLYVVLTIALSGIFAIYWLWTLIKDPHTHFEGHSAFEDHLMDALPTQ